ATLIAGDPPPARGSRDNFVKYARAHGPRITPDGQNDAGKFEEIDTALAIFNGGYEGLWFPKGLGEIGLLQAGLVPKGSNVCPNKFVILRSDPHAAQS